MQCAAAHGFIERTDGDQSRLTGCFVVAAGDDIARLTQLSARTLDVQTILKAATLVDANPLQRRFMVSQCSLFSSAERLNCSLSACDCSKKAMPCPERCSALSLAQRTAQCTMCAMSECDAFNSPQHDLSVVIVNYKTCDLLLALLESIYARAADLRLECIVLDNASFDGSAQAVASRFPQVRFVQNAVNRYFSAAYTQGVQMAQGAYVLVLNPDMEVRGATLSQLLSALQADPSIGAATTTMYFPDGCLQRNGSRFTPFGYLVLNYTFLGKLYGLLLPRAWQALQDWLWYADWDRRTAREIDVLPGSAIIARREVWCMAGYFDSRLKMYFSDDYFSRRVQALGLRTVYLPSDGILHYEGGSAKQVSRRALNLYLRDLIVYTALVHGKFAAALLALLLIPTWLVQWIKAR